jgi:hypothetical protein
MVLENYQHTTLHIISCLKNDIWAAVENCTSIYQLGMHSAYQKNGRGKGIWDTTKMVILSNTHVETS